MKQNGYVSTCLMLAKGILHERSLRRKMMTQLVIFMLVLVAVGTWVIDDWLRDGVVRFSFFWGLVGMYVVFIILMAVYDILKVMRGE